MYRAFVPSSHVQQVVACVLHVPCILKRETSVVSERPKKPACLGCQEKASSAVWICNASRNNARFVHLEGVNIRYDSGSGAVRNQHLRSAARFLRSARFCPFWAFALHWVDYVLAVVKAVLCECMKAIDLA